MNAQDYLNAIRALDPTLTQEQIAQAARLSQPVISKVESGLSSNVRLSTYFALKALHERMVKERLRVRRKSAKAA